MSKIIIKFAELTTDTVFVDRSRSYGIDEIPSTHNHNVPSENTLSAEDYLGSYNSASADPSMLTQMRLSAIKDRVQRYSEQQEKNDAEEERRRKFVNGLLGI